MDEWSHLDSLWSVDEEILESGVGPAQMDNRAGEASASASASASATQQQAVARNKLIKTRSARKNSSTNVTEIAEEEGVKKKMMKTDKTIIIYYYYHYSSNFLNVHHTID